MDTRGHAATQGGLRGHSIGETYPFNVIWQGGYETGRWCVFDCRNSHVFHTGSGTCKDACELAEQLKEISLVMANWADPHRLKEAVELDQEWRRQNWRTLLTPEQSQALIREGVGSWETAREYFQNNWNGELYKIQEILDGPYGALGGPDFNAYEVLVNVLPNSI